MSAPDELSRRRALRAGAAVLAGAVTGCAGTGAGPPTPDASVFHRPTFDGPDLVVALRADHGVARVNLIGPDGSTVAGAAVPTGATTVRLPILRIQPASGFAHYEPGGHELVAVLEDRTESVELELRPDLRVTAVEPYRAGARSSAAGRLAVTVENVGTGPTWVYGITYPGAPNPTLTAELGDDPGVTSLVVPERDTDLIVEPGRQVAVVGEDAPLVFVDEDEPACRGTVEFAVVVGTAVGDPLARRIRVALGGAVTPAGLTGEYTCAAATVAVVDGGTDG